MGTLSSFCHTGYIEGYYGRILSWEQRGDLIRSLGHAGLSSYLYAPKEDPLHRMSWRLPYPSSWRHAFSRLSRLSVRSGVTLIPALAPGLSFDYDSAKDYQILKKKFRSLIDCGCTTLALLMDDIPATLPAANEHSWRSLGHAHSVLIERLLNDLRELRSDVSLWFCPTIYTDQFVTGPVTSSSYLQDLAEALPKETTVLWTGPAVVAKTLNRATVGPVASLFGSPLVVWDNLYAHDYCPMRLFAGPFYGRHQDLKKCCAGLLLNPTGLPLTDRLLCDLLGAYCAGETPASAFKTVISAWKMPPQFSLVAPLFASPFKNPEVGWFTPARVKRLRAAVEWLVFTWKGDLHQEWYPYLYQLSIDLELFTRHNDSSTRRWILRRYGTPLSHRIT